MCVSEKDLTLEKIKDLSDDKLIRISNVIEKRNDWFVRRSFAKEQDIYEVLADGGDGVYVSIVQFFFGEHYGLGPEDFIRYFQYHEDSFVESSPTCGEWSIIMGIINE